MMWTYQTIDRLLDFLHIDREKIELRQVEVSFDNNGIQVVSLVYRDLKTDRLNRCLIGINGLDQANVITPGLYNR